MKTLRRLVWVITVALASALPVCAQQACPQPPALEKITGKNIFTDQQEIDLGDAMGESLAREMPVIDDPSLTAHLEELGARLTHFLPPNNLRFRFFLVEMPEVNAFSLSGGRIYVARKMVALTHRDDELAGVIAHEMGHIVTHQQAIRMTQLLKQVLGVTQVGDRADIYDKFQRLLENERRKPVHAAGESEGDQYIADQVALFAMARAGFAPQAYVDLWDRFNATHGKTGNWLSDFFGETKPEQKRLRELLKSVAAMPPECARIAPSSSADFAAWQEKVIATSASTHAESLPGLLLRQKLALPLRPDINNLRFSPDGKFVLAQDEGGIHVLSRDPFAFLFFIDAPEADKAMFSPDSKSVIFKTPGLRVESWDIASRKRTWVHEMTLRVGCVQSLLSPDGQYLACLDKEFTLVLMEVATGNQLASKKQFFQIRNPFMFWIILLLELESSSNLHFINFGFSPDGHYFLAGSSDQSFAYDLAAKHDVNMPSSIRNLTHAEFAFVGNDRILGINMLNPKKCPIVSFPAGERVQEVTLSTSLHLSSATHGNYAVMGPLKDGKRGILDLATGKFIAVFKEDAGDIYDGTVVFEEIDGRILLVDAPSKTVVARLQLTQSHLGDSKAIAVSSDFNWLAASTASRGAVWDIVHNVRVQYVRAFTGGWFADDDMFYADFPKKDQQERAMVELNAIGGAVPVFSIGELLAAEEGPYLLVRTPARDNPYVRKNWTYELRDFRSKATVWTRHFAQEPPSLAWNARHDAVLMGWPVASDAGREELKQFPAVKSSAEKEDTFYELVDVAGNSPTGTLLVKTNKYSFTVKKAELDGDWVAVAVSGDRVLIYSIASGREMGHVFGYAPMVSNAAGAYAVSAGEGEVNLYALANSELRRAYQFPAPVAYQKFSSDGKRLFVLTRDQTAYILDLNYSPTQAAQVEKPASQ